jgi:CheY-like chemotaxis protein
LRQILVNLIGNAFKFTERGQITVSVDADPAEKAPGALRFAIMDTGIGIEPDQLDSIFSSFVQADVSTARIHGGAGLGLSICKQLALLMHGSVAVESKVGCGSTFTLTARFGLQEPHDSAVKESPQVSLATDAPMQALRILLADDCFDNRVLVEAYLADTSHELHLAEDGASAIRKFASAEYDIVLMDMHMPVVDGCVAVREIRALEKHRQIGPTPIIAITADAFPESIERAMSSGCTGHLSKPVLRTTLLDALHRYTKDRPGGDRQRPSSERSQRPIPPIVGVDEDLQRLIPGYLDTRRKDVRAMTDALSRGDFDLIWTLGHNMCGTGKGYGMLAITNLGRDLADAAKAHNSESVRVSLKALSSWLDQVRVDEARGARERVP